MSFSSPICPKTPQRSHVYTPSRQVSPFPPLPSLYATMPRPSRHKSPLAASPEIAGCPSEKRRRQYKSIDSSFGTPTRASRRTGSMEEPTRTQLLRHNMKDLIFKTRKELRRKRSFGPPSSGSDGFDVDMDCEEETDDQLMDEEFYCRLINNTNANVRRGYNTSYRREVGSSLDPDLEDITKWERELSHDRASFFVQDGASMDAPEPEPLPEFDPDAMAQDELEELEMYAQEAAALDELSAMSEKELMAFLEEINADDID